MKPDPSSLGSCSSGPGSSAAVAPMFMEWFMNLADDGACLPVVDHLVVTVLPPVDRAVDEVPLLQAAEPLQLVLRSPEERRPSTRRSPLHRKGDMRSARGHERHLDATGGTSTPRAGRSIRACLARDLLWQRLIAASTHNPLDRHGQQHGSTSPVSCGFSRRPRKEIVGRTSTEEVADMCYGKGRP